MRWVIALFLIIPIAFTFILYWLLRKIGLSKNKSFGYASDCTTPLFIISLPIIFHTIWGYSIHLVFYTSLIVFAIIMTYIEWRSKKEIHIVPLLKKIWRFYFLFFMLLYVIFMIVGLVYWMFQYMMG